VGISQVYARLQAASFNFGFLVSRTASLSLSELHPGRMRALPNVLGQGVRVISSPGSSARHATRAFNISSASQEGICASSPVITRKKFADFPKARILPDGTRALPLEEWHGGLPGTTSRSDKVNLLGCESAHVPNELLSSVHLIVARFAFLADTIADHSLHANQNTEPMKREHRTKGTLSANDLVLSGGGRSLENKVVQSSHLQHTEIGAGAYLGGSNSRHFMDFSVSRK
jgi:hypothetical protein